MAEPRRVQLETAHQVPAKKKRTEVCPTRRFQLSLGSLGEDASCAEYSYSDLLKSTRQASDTDKDDQCGDGEEDQIRAIARRLEEKYGSRPVKKRRKGRIAWEDYVDRGMGYDETDPFIDNEEAYDELVPSTLTTKLGGFYINSGELEFRNLSGSDSEDFQGEGGARIRGSSNTKALAQQRHREISESGRRGAHRGPRGPRKHKEQPLSLPAVAATGVGGNSAIVEAIESVVRGGGGGVEDDAGGSGSSNSSSSGGEELVQQGPGEASAPRLPENLPADLEAAVKRLKQAAFLSAEGKCKFFRGTVNQLLLSVELRARELGPGQRSLVFAHLASYLPCTKETLLKRAKKLRLDQEDGRLGEPLRRYGAFCKGPCLHRSMAVRNIVGCVWLGNSTKLFGMKACLKLQGQARPCPRAVKKIVEVC